MSLSVVGFRFDAAESMQVSDIAAVSTFLARCTALDLTLLIFFFQFIAPLTTKPYVTQEVWSSSTDPVPPNIYTTNGDVLGFSATEAMGTAFLDGGGLSALLNWPESGWVASDNMNIFVA